MAPERILVRTPSELKEAVFAEPALNALRENFPDAGLWAAGPARISELFASRGLFQGTIDIAPEENILDARETILEIRGMKFPVGLILTDSFGAVLLFYASGIPERWGYQREGALPMLTKAVKPADRRKPPVHRVEHYLGLIRGLGLEFDRRMPSLDVTDDEKRLAVEMLAGLGRKSGRPLVALAPAATQGSAGIWPAERFAAAAAALHEGGADIMLLGEEADGGAADSVESALQFPAVKPPRALPLRTTMALLSQSSLVIADDNDHLHLAAALGVPAVAVIGPTAPAVAAPLGDKVSVVMADAPCRPCQYTDCPWDHRCMKNIEAGDVTAAARSLL